MMSEDNVRAHADPCPYWLAGPLESSLRRLLHDPKKIFNGLVEDGQTALDLGCGPGYFSLGLAEMVGEKGCVIAVDLQPEMLERVRIRAERRGLLPRLILQRCTYEKIGLDRPVDFGLAFWMLHEVRNPAGFMAEVYEAIKPAGKFLLVEPDMHVPEKAFQKTVELVCKTGLNVISKPRIKMSRAVLFQK
jgi:ubiquinone/menaquinone biosynthesis C-methylase UbiE